MTDQLEISNVKHGEGKVVYATILVHVSNSSVAYLDVYVGFDDKLYVRSNHDPRSASDIQSLIQWAAWLAAYEQWVIYRIREEAMKVFD